MFLYHATQMKCTYAYWVVVVPTLDVSQRFPSRFPMLKAIGMFYEVQKSNGAYICKLCKATEEDITDKTITDRHAAGAKVTLEAIHSSTINLHKEASDY